jgi:putative tricarboxylic transport membrane protein
MESAKPVVVVDRSGMAIAAALLAIAAVIFWDALSLPSVVYGVGPRAVPMLIAGGLVLLAAANALLAWRGDFPAREEYDPQALVLILGGLVALIAIIGLNGGFIPATTILFVATAAAFGRRAIPTDLTIGFVLSVVVYLMFSKLLSLSLPMGPIERLF